MSLDQAVMKVIEEMTNIPPEIEFIGTGFEYSDKYNCYIMISCSDDEIVDTGQTLNQSVKQNAVISVITVIRKQDLETARAANTTTAGPIIERLRMNPTLISTQYPLGFAITSKLLKPRQGEDHVNSNLVFTEITLEAKYFRSLF
jgi:hypothetical protein